MEKICRICFRNKRLTIKQWNECPVQLADYKAETYWCFLPRFITRWWYFRKNPKHLC